MKLKTRLIVVFCTMIIGPVVLLFLFMGAFGALQIRSVEKTYGVEFSVNNLVNSVQTISESTHQVWEQMHEQAQQDSEKFLNFSYLQEINDTLRGKRSFLLLIKGGEVYYQGHEFRHEENLPELLPAYDEADDDGKSVYIGGSLRAMVKQVDIGFADGETGSAYIITSVAEILPGLRTVFLEAAILMVIVLIITAVGMTIWIYTGINTPIRKLQDATRRIAQGDLDFTLEADGNDEISELTRDFEAMRKRLSESEEEKKKYDQENKELISNISHDLKTPITTIKGYVEGIMDGVADTPEKMDRYIRTIYNKANDMDRLVNELTFYSKIDTNRIPYHFTRLNVAEYFADCAEEVCLDLEERGIRFTYENKVDEETMIIGDPEQLKRVIDNIIGNSVKYMDKPTGEINLRISDVGDFIQVELEDNGKGIEAKDLLNIFDRFYRADPARAAQGGSGIGLSIVRKIIEDHSGKIWATSKAGRGTTMYFVIRKYQEVKA